MNKLRRQLLAGPYLVWIIGFIILPLLMILYYAFFDENGSFTLEYLSHIASPINIHAMTLSLELGLAATIICLLLAYPLAMILNNLQIKNNQQNYLDYNMLRVVKEKINKKVAFERLLSLNAKQNF